MNPKNNRKNRDEEFEGPQPHLSINIDHDLGKIDEDYVNSQDNDDNNDDEFCLILDSFGCEALERIEEESDRIDECQWIRVEKKPDTKVLETIHTQQDVRQAIDCVKQEQKYRSGRSVELYSRCWIPQQQLLDDDDDSSSDESVNGIDINLRDRRGDDREFSVLQFNTLAEGLSVGPSVKKPFQVMMSCKGFSKNEWDRASFGGFTSVHMPEIALDFALRRWRILEVLLNTSRHDESLFDLIAMEEVDRYHGFFLPMLRLFGYEGRFVPKTRAPGLFLGWYSDGCCLFWKRSVFQHIAEIRGEYSVGNQVFMIHTMQHNTTGRILVTAVTHLKAQKGAAQDKIRRHQVEELLLAISNRVKEILIQGGGDAVSVLLMGDLNTEPVLAVNTNGDIDIDQSDAVHRILNRAIEMTMFGKPSSLRSAYNIKNHDFYTTYKTRGSETTKRVIDYIFYSDTLRCLATMSVPTEVELESSKLPGLRYPSDHISIAATFRFR